MRGKNGIHNKNKKKNKWQDNKKKKKKYYICKDIVYAR